MEFVLSGKFITGLLVGLVLCWYWHKRMATKAG